MTPDQTQELFHLIAGYWPRVHISAETMDAWAVKLVPIPYEIARQAVIDHNDTPAGKWPPEVADICAAHRAAQRNIRPNDRMLADITANRKAASREQQERTQRIQRCSTQVGMLDWLKTLDEAKQQLVEETGHEIFIPKQLVAKRACDIIESNVW